MQSIHRKGDCDLKKDQVELVAHSPDPFLHLLSDPNVELESAVQRVVLPRCVGHGLVGIDNKIPRELVLILNLLHYPARLKILLTGGIEAHPSELAILPP